MEAMMEYTIHLFNAGGFVMYPLVLFMLAACTILFERIRTYRNINHELQQLSDSIDAGRNSNNWSTLENSIKNSNDALSRFVSPIVESVYSAEGLENRLHDIGAPTVITGGVSEALVATATGLSVAIVALAIHSWCTDKVNSDIAKLEQKLGSIMDLYIRSQR